jgi:hypothetical protein
MSDLQNKTYSKAWEWALGALSMLVPYIAWSGAGGTFTSHYSVFPLLGLWAWSLMWTHYMYGTLSLISKKFTRSKLYKRATGYAVLALILLHPLLLINRLYEDTGVKPPDSYINYVGEDNKLFVLFGTLSLLCFLAYELLHRLRKLDIVRRIWVVVSASQAVAMTLIFIHGLQLGSTLYGGWFQAYWVLLGCLLMPCFAVILRYDWRHRV